MELINDRGVSAKEFFLSILESADQILDELNRFSEDQKLEYVVLLNKLKKVNSSNKITTGEKGKALEDIVYFLLESIGIFEIIRNVRTSTNEVDLLVVVGKKGKHFSHLMDDAVKKGFLAECKNYNKTIGVTWIGKFHSLISCISGCKIGILFSYHGLTGRGQWDAAKGLTKKLFMLRERPEDRIHIVNFNYDDFVALSNGTTFLNLLEAKINSIRTDTNVTTFLTEQHPAESHFRHDSQ